MTCRIILRYRVTGEDKWWNYNRKPVIQYLIICKLIIFRLHLSCYNCNPIQLMFFLCQCEKPFGHKSDRQDVHIIESKERKYQTNKKIDKGLTINLPFFMKLSVCRVMLNYKINITHEIYNNANS